MIILLFIYPSSWDGCEIKKRWSIPVLASIFIFGCFCLPLIHNQFLRQMFTPILLASFLILPLLWFMGEIIDFQRDFIIRHTDSLDRIRSLDWQSFEHLVGAIYAQMGYEIEICGGCKPDNNIDHLLRKDGKKYVVQCKRYTCEDVGVKLVRELYGTCLHENADLAILVTCGGFTDAARTFSVGKPLELVDGPELYRMLEKIHLHPNPNPDSDPIGDFLKQMIERFSILNAGDLRRCPKCDAEMEPRLNKKDNKWFWGCNQFHQNGCKGSQSLGTAEKKLVEAVTQRV